MLSIIWNLEQWANREKKHIRQWNSPFWTTFIVKHYYIYIYIWIRKHEFFQGYSHQILKYLTIEISNSNNGYGKTSVWFTFTGPLDVWERNAYIMTLQKGRQFAWVVSLPRQSRGMTHRGRHCVGFMATNQRPLWGWFSTRVTKFIRVPDPNLLKIWLTLTWKIIIRSGHRFAHGMTA